MKLDMLDINFEIFPPILVAIFAIFRWRQQIKIISFEKPRLLALRI